jgi:hypothetical protein
MMNTSLFLVGEIGGNDYNIPMFDEVPLKKIRTFAPIVVAKISSTITVSYSLLLLLLSPFILLSVPIPQIMQGYIVDNDELSLQKLIKLGAKTFLVPGNYPIGCIPKYLILFKSDKKEDYEPETGCLRWLNEFSEYHNKILIDELEKLRKLHSGVSIIYADYYGAAMEVFLSPEKFGEFNTLCFVVQNHVVGCLLLTSIHQSRLTCQTKNRLYFTSVKKHVFFLCLG